MNRSAWGDPLGPKRKYKYPLVRAWCPFTAKPTMFVRLTSLLVSLMALSNAAMASAPRDHVLYTTGYDGQIRELSINRAGTLSGFGASVATNASGTNPSWLEYSALVYSVNEAFPGRVFAHTRALEPRGSVSSGGDGPVSAQRGLLRSSDLLFVANYNGGSAAVLPIARDGTLGEAVKVFQFEGTGPVKDRQDKSYAHQVRVAQDGRYVYVCDLGADEIHRLHVTKDGQVELDGKTSVPAGSGPRHLALYEGYAYLAAELSNTVHAFTRNSVTGELTPLGEPLPAYPPNTNYNATGLTTAEIDVSPDGKFVYVSSRGDEDEDHIAIYARETDGSLCFKHWVSTHGKMPRHLSLSLDKHASLLAVANQGSGNVVIFKRDHKSGSLHRTDTIKNLGPVNFAGFAPY